MAAPNFKSLAVISGKSSPLTVTAAAADIVANPAGSNKVMKVNALYISNTTATDVKATILFKRGATTVHISKNIIIPTEAAFDAIRKHIYLEEGDSLQLQGSAVGLEAVAGYEELA